MATGFQHITNSNDNIIKAVRSEAQALLTISHTLFNQTRTIERDLACSSVVKNIDISINIDTEISERYQY